MYLEWILSFINVYSTESFSKYIIWMSADTSFLFNTDLKLRQAVALVNEIK